MRALWNMNIMLKYLHQLPNFGPTFDRCLPFAIIEGFFVDFLYHFVMFCFVTYQSSFGGRKGFGPVRDLP